MKTSFCFACSVLGLALFGGCSKSDKPVSDDFQPVIEANDSTSENPKAVTAVVNNEQSPALRPTFASAEPDEIVRDFLAALQGGDQRVAENMLTDKARYETKRANLDVRPVASPSATYRVGETKFATQQKEVAHVESLWSEADEDGLHSSFSITWVLRRQANDTWRIAGMLTAPAEGQSPIFLNFENPLEMLAKAEQIESTGAADGSKVQQASFTEPIE